MLLIFCSPKNNKNKIILLNIIKIKIKNIYFCHRGQSATTVINYYCLIIIKNNDYRDCRLTERKRKTMNEKRLEDQIGNRRSVRRNL